MSDMAERRMIAETGYEVKQAIHIGDKEFLLAENMGDPDGQFYMKAEYATKGIFGQYAHIIYSSDYLPVVEEFIGSINRQIIAVRDEIARADYQSKPIFADMCFPHDYGQNITGKVVAIKASVLRPEYRRGDVQLVYVTGGSGAMGNARGSAVFCCHLNSGEHTRFERQNVQGVIKELPTWAAERLDVIKRQQNATLAKTQTERSGR